MSVPMSDTEDAQRLFDAMHKASRSQAAPTLQQRLANLDKLEQLQMEHREEICEAIFDDYGGTRNKEFNKMVDVLMGLNTLRQVRAKLQGWMQEETVDPEFPMFLVGKCKAVWQPLGVVLIVCPWNYPMHLPMSGLADVLGAGNRAIIKPSEYTPKTSLLLQRLIQQYFRQDEVTVVQGEAKIASFLCGLPFDKILYTGSTMVGKLVAKAAAANLTPLLLELGGKSPVLVCPDADLETCAQNIITSKMNNGGQICVGADYVLVPEGKAKEFADIAVANIREHWGPLAEHPEFVGIISRRHYDRIHGLVTDAEAKGATIVELDASPEQFDPEKSLRYPPKIILGQTDEMDIASEEVFGPLLSVLEYKSLDGAIEYINARPRPLGLYLYSNSAATKKQIVERTTSGGVTINGIAMHCVPQTVGFGGVGASGMGSYHGPDGFRCFSHKKAVFECKTPKMPSGPADHKPAEFLITVNPQAKLAALGKIVPLVTLLVGFGAVYFTRAREPVRQGLIATLKCGLSALGSN